MNIRICKNTLISYINQNQVAWQKWGGLIEVSHDATLPHCPDISNVVDKYKVFDVVSRDELLIVPFQDPAEWSNENDVLVLGDDNILLCIPGHVFEELVKQS